MTWDQQDVNALNLIGSALGPIRVLNIEENRMSEQTPEPENQDWNGEQEQGGAVSYPELPSNPHNHRFTISVDGRGPMIVVRGNTAQETREGFEELINGGVAAAAQAAYQAFKAAPAAMPQAPANQYQQAPQGSPQGGVNYNPQMPPPNQPYPGQPAWQQAGAPQAQGAPAWGGGQQAAQGGEKPAYPAPQGWYRLNVPYPGGKDQLHALATGLGIPKGNPSKGGVYNFFSAPTKAWYCAPEVAQAFAQFTPMAV